ncbi:MAG: hypothetical protein WBB39_01925 [Candidatus Saccharimonadales bacterium]
MEPNYLVFVLDEDGKHPYVIAGGTLEDMQEVYGNRVAQYGERRLHLRRVKMPYSIWAATDPV